MPAAKTPSAPSSSTSAAALAETPATPIPGQASLERIAGMLPPRTFGVDGREIIKLVVDELTTMKVDAIISPANNESLLNTTIASQIAVKAGRELSKEINKIGKITLGDAVITSAGKLKAKHIIHAACMDYSQSTNEECLVMATRNALAKARENKLKTLALPPLDSSGKQFPLKRCAELMISEVIRHAEKEATLEEVYFVLENDRVKQIFEECLRQV